MHRMEVQETRILKNLLKLPFHFFDSGPAAGDRRIIIFANNVALQHLVSCNEWYLEGNFECVPPYFKQLYVLRAKLDAGAVSCVYGLWPGKARSRFMRMQSR